jgi:hypothetical protein
VAGRSKVQWLAGLVPLIFTALPPTLSAKEGVGDESTGIISLLCSLYVQNFKEQLIWAYMQKSTFSSG